MNVRGAEPDSNIITPYLRFKSFLIALRVPRVLDTKRDWIWVLLEDSEENANGIPGEGETSSARSDAGSSIVQELLAFLTGSLILRHPYAEEFRTPRWSSRGLSSDPMGDRGTGQPPS